MSTWTSEGRFPHEAFDGSIVPPWDEEEVRKQGDNRVERAILPWERPPIDGIEVD
jgi:hypothetical protein